MESLANVELKNIFEWMTPNGLTFHPKKTLALNLFLYLCKLYPQLTLTLNNDYIKSANFAKQQEVLIDELLFSKCLIDSPEKKKKKNYLVV